MVVVIVCTVAGLIIAYTCWNPSRSCLQFLAQHKQYWLVRAIAMSKDRYCRSTAVCVLAKVQSEDVLPYLLRFTDDKYETVRGTIAYWSHTMLPTNAIRCLYVLLDDQNPVVLFSTLRALRQTSATNCPSIQWDLILAEGGRDYSRGTNAAPLLKHLIYSGAVSVSDNWDKPEQLDALIVDPAAGGTSQASFSRAGQQHH